MTPTEAAADMRERAAQALERKLIKESGPDWGLSSPAERQSIRDHNRIVMVCAAETRALPLPTEAAEPGEGAVADLIKAVPRTPAERASTPTKTFEQFSHEHGRRTNSEMNTDLILMKEALGIARAAIQTTLSSRGRPRPEEFLNSDSFATALLSWVACKDALTAIANALQEPQS